ncbi:hypothetical protein IV37_GL000033 [Fructilactobacillus fructivorans]|nr:hypothetical protein IV37_GL000033 [Fructilactobacillus fructivorans]
MLLTLKNNASTNNAVIGLKINGHKISNGRKMVLQDSDRNVYTDKLPNDFLPHQTKQLLLNFENIKSKNGYLNISINTTSGKVKTNLKVVGKNINTTRIKSTIVIAQLKISSKSSLSKLFNTP